MKLSGTANDIRWGITVMLSFLLLVAMTSVFLPQQINTTEYHAVDSTQLLTNPGDYEDRKISISVTIADVDDQTNPEGQLLETTKGLHVFLSSSLGEVAVGDHISLRGISRLSSVGYIEVTELYIHDYPIDGVSRSLLHSIPGIIMFVALFFAIFTFDRDRFAFVSRGN
ncbi:MAG: hypothetical protein GF309_12030 [Candidatus Lokiarchaeota archaeon]|nr:hypothetical protein [Candidatus Lokiarchaeota archaeon]